MIEVKCQRNPDDSVHKLTIVVDEVSLDAFKRVLFRGLNTWDRAPQELKDLDSMLNALRPSKEAQVKA